MEARICNIYFREKKPLSLSIIQGIRVIVILGRLYNKFVKNKIEEDIFGKILENYTGLKACSTTIDISMAFREQNGYKRIKKSSLST